MWSKIREYFTCPFFSSSSNLILSFSRQIRAWKRANRKMGWGISEDEFNILDTFPELTQNDIIQGYSGFSICYGFGDDGKGNADAVLSGKVVWDYALKIKSKRTWQCEYIRFGDPAYIRLRPDAPPRPKGFYFAKIKTGDRYINLTVAQARRLFSHDTGCASEGLQFLIITNPHFQKLMDERRHPFMAFADYDIAPYGYHDFFDSMQVFVSHGILGLGIGNVDTNYPFFGIPSIKIVPIDRNVLDMGDFN